MSVLLHGCYDSETLETLRSFSLATFAFDLRGSSPNLIPFHSLQTLLKKLPNQEVFLTFENDRKETILSFLDLLKKEPVRFVLLFRDHQSVQYYQEIGQPFFWMFHPDGDWGSIIASPLIKGIILPLKWQNFYQHNAHLWNAIDGKHLKVYLHAESFRESEAIDILPGMNLSIDLTSEIEQSFRRVDQIKLKQMKIWRKLNEDTAF